MGTERNKMMDELLIMPESKKEKTIREHEEYLKSKEWKEILKKSETAINKNYTIIYRDTDGDLKEAWHYLSEDNIEYLKGKYKNLKKYVVRFVLKELPYGEYLKTITGNSKNSR